MLCLAHEVPFSGLDEMAFNLISLGGPLPWPFIFGFGIVFRFILDPSTVLPLP